MKNQTSLAGRRVNNRRLSIESHHWKKSSENNLFPAPSRLNWTTKFESARSMQRCQRVAFAPSAGGDKHFSWARYIIALSACLALRARRLYTCVCARSMSAGFIDTTHCVVPSFNLVYLAWGIIFARAVPLH